MLKTKIIERYKPPAKTLELLNSITNIKLEIANDNPTDKLKNNITEFTEHFYNGGIISCPYVEENNIIDNLILIPKN